MTLRQRMQSLACNVFLSDLTLEFDAVGVVLGHGFHPWKARRPRSIPNPRPVHCQGRTPELRLLLLLWACGQALALSIMSTALKRCQFVDEAMSCKQVNRKRDKRS